MTLIINLLAGNQSAVIQLQYTIRKGAYIFILCASHQGAYIIVADNIPDALAHRVTMAAGQKAEGLIQKQTLGRMVIIFANATLSLSSPEI